MVPIVLIQNTSSAILQQDLWYPLRVTRLSLKKKEEEQKQKHRDSEAQVHRSKMLVRTGKEGITGNQKQMHHQESGYRQAGGLWKGWYITER